MSRGGQSSSVQDRARQCAKCRATLIYAGMVVCAASEDHQVLDSIMSETKLLEQPAHAEGWSFERRVVGCSSLMVLLC